MAEAQPIGVPRSHHEGRLDGLGTIGRKAITPDAEAHAIAHFTVLQHMTLVSPYIVEHVAKLREEYPKATDAWRMKEHNKIFNQWIKKRIVGGSSTDTLTWLAKGPTFTVQTWQGYDINGYTFYTKAQDAKSIYQNSSVCIEAQDTSGNKEFYYGIIEEIWELDYVYFKIPLFRCQWVNLKHVKVDKYGVTYVDLNRVAYKSEPFVLATQVTQVFYVKDLAHKKHHVVMSGKRRIVGVENVVDEDEYNQFDDLPPIGDRIRVEEEQLEETCYVREDHSEGLVFKGNKLVE